MAGGDDGETPLFDGVDGRDAPTLNPGDEVVENDQPPLDALDSIGLVAWWHDLTYREVHAFTFGFVPWFLAVAIGSTVLVTVGVGVVAAAVYGRAEGRYSWVPRYVLKEPHYALGGSLLAWLSASLLLGVLSVTGALWGVLP